MQTDILLQSTHQLSHFIQIDLYTYSRRFIESIFQCLNTSHCVRTDSLSLKHFKRLSTLYILLRYAPLSPGHNPPYLQVRAVCVQKRRQNSTIRACKYRLRTERGARREHADSTQHFYCMQNFLCVRATDSASFTCSTDDALSTCVLVRAALSTCVLRTW